ncbi:ciliary microtubule inner protein 2B [Symphorus nematophorus]
MDKYAPKFSKVLSDPHYIPGYTGYCPQLKLNMGKSYDKLTAELQTTPEVKPSNRLVLQMGQLPSTESDAALTSRSIPDSNLKKVIPGYTGFIPRHQSFFGCSYSETCRKALSEFHQEGHLRIQRRAKDLPAVVKCANQQFERPKLPMKAISDEVVIYKPLKSYTPPGRPYCMDDDNPHKYLISGFAGHVPKYRFLIGKGYPIMTNQALIHFGKQQRGDPTSPDIPGGKDSTVAPMPTIHPVPGFTGHIPGYRYIYGHTFGRVSEKTGKERH